MHTVPLCSTTDCRTMVPSWHVAETQPWPGCVRRPDSVAPMAVGDNPMCHSKRCMRGTSVCTYSVQPEASEGRKRTSEATIAAALLGYRHSVASIILDWNEACSSPSFGSSTITNMQAVVFISAAVTSDPVVTVGFAVTRPSSSSRSHCHRTSTPSPVCVPWLLHKPCRIWNPTGSG